MRTNSTIFHLFCLCLLLGLVLPGSVSAAGPWKGRILDMDTGEPLKDAVVLAEWNKVTPTVGGDVSETFHVAEALTDQDGHFEIPAYVSINLTPLTRIDRPYFTIFKPGYLSIRHFSGDFLLPGATDEPDEKKAMWPLHKYTTKTAANLIEVPKLKNNEERQKNLRRLPCCLPKETTPNLIRLEKKEELNLRLSK